jgi:hypothetical protein
MRVLDFFVKVNVTFFFTLLPFYYTPNTVAVENQNDRRIENMNKSVSDLGATITQVNNLTNFRF